MFTTRAREVVDVINTAPEVDVWCLQEMWFELSWLECFEAALVTAYSVLKVKRGGSRQDGCAMLVRRPHTYMSQVHRMQGAIAGRAVQHLLIHTRSVIESAAVHYADVTQRVAQVVTIETESGEVFVVGNTHLGRGETEVDRELRAGQGAALVEALASAANQAGRAAIIAGGGWGDAGEVARMLEGAGMLSVTSKPPAALSRPSADMIMYRYAA